MKTYKKKDRLLRPQKGPQHFPDEKYQNVNFCQEKNTLSKWVNPICPERR